MERQVIGTLAGVGIGDEAGMSPGLDEAQGRDGETIRLGHRVGQQQAREVDGSVAGVEQFDEVVPRGEACACKPLIDAERAGIAGGERGVGCTERRRAQGPRVVVTAPDRTVRYLGAERDGVEDRAAAA